LTIVMLTPSMSCVPEPSVAVHCGLDARHAACESAAAPFIAPIAPFSLAMRACVCRFAKRGSAVAARTLRMMITTISSISVKPRCRYVTEISMHSPATAVPV